MGRMRLIGSFFLAVLATLFGAYSVFAAIFTVTTTADAGPGPDLAKVLGQLTRELRRPIGVLLTRRGQIQEVIVGTELTLSSATLTLFRAGSRALRGLRFIRTQLHDQPLNQEMLTDLAFMRLDLVGVLSVADDGQLGHMYMASLLPTNAAGKLFKVWPSIPFHSIRVAFDDLFRGSKQNFSRLVLSTRLHMGRNQQSL